jgi:hypothetical protein
MLEAAAADMAAAWETGTLPIPPDMEPFMVRNIICPRLPDFENSHVSINLSSLCEAIQASQ